MTFITAEWQRQQEKKKFIKKQEKIRDGKAKTENKSDWRLGAFFTECRGKK